MCCPHLPLVICTLFPIFLAMTDKLPKNVVHTIWVPTYSSNSLQFSLIPLYTSRTDITKVTDPEVADVTRHLIIKWSFCSIKHSVLAFLKLYSTDFLPTSLVMFASFFFFVYLFKICHIQNSYLNFLLFFHILPVKSYPPYHDSQNQTMLSAKFHVS